MRILEHERHDESDSGSDSGDWGFGVTLAVGIRHGRRPMAAGGAAVSSGSSRLRKVCGGGGTRHPCTILVGLPSCPCAVAPPSGCGAGRVGEWDMDCDDIDSDSTR
jgi:hypothetical protein